MIGIGIAFVTHQDHHEREDGGEPVLVWLEVEGDQQHGGEHDRPEEEPDGASLALEALLGR